MTFLNILGLLGLLSILALIVIYILKPKYQEKTIGSSFIWKLSLKYKKRKLPFEWIRGSLLIILQIIILLLLTIILMKPNTILETNSGEKIVILDVSASMLAIDDNQSRLDKAIKEIDELAKETINNNDRFTLITAGAEATVLAYRTESYEYVKNHLSNISESFTTSNVDDAVLLTEDIVSLNPNAEIIYYTSNDVEDPGQVTIRNMSDNEWNMAILDFEGAYDVSLNYVFTVTVASYGKDMENAVLELLLDGDTETSTTIDLVDGEVLTFSWKIPGLNEESFEKASIQFLDVEDDFSYDNELQFHNNDSLFYVQIIYPEVTDVINTTNVYITRALRSLNRDFSIKTSVDLDTAATTDYDLYIYIDEVPDVLPEDGTIWIFNPDQLPTSYDLTVGADVDVSTTTLSVGTDTVFGSDVLDLVRPNEMTVTKYKEITNYDEYDVILMANDAPALLHRNMNGLDVVIFTFGFDYSNLPILFLDFPLLVRNLSNNTVKPTIDSNLYTAGEFVIVNENPMTETIIVTNEDEEFTYTSVDFPVTISADVVGDYTITEIYSDDRIKTNYFTVRLANEESDFDYLLEVIESPIISESDVPIIQKENLKSLLLYFGIAVLVLVIVEWEVQHREQY